MNQTIEKFGDKRGSKSTGQKTLTDPLRIIGLPEVVRRTGYSRQTVVRLLAKDVEDNSPGRNFPAPLKLRSGSNRMEWREIAVLKWIESREAAVA